MTAIEARAGSSYPDVRPTIIRLQIVEFLLRRNELLRSCAVYQCHNVEHVNTEIRKTVEHAGDTAHNRWQTGRNAAPRSRVSRSRSAPENGDARLPQTLPDALRDLSPLPAGAAPRPAQCMAHRPRLTRTKTQTNQQFIRSAAVDQQARPQAGLTGICAHSNLLVRGNPFGASRPASARLPRQSASSFSDSLNRRPAESVQVSPTSARKALRSDSPPSL